MLQISLLIYERRLSSAPVVSVHSLCEVCPGYRGWNEVADRGLRPCFSATCVLH